jgi:hypothetical protein
MFFKLGYGKPEQYMWDIMNGFMQNKMKRMSSFYAHAHTHTNFGYNRSLRNLDISPIQAGLCLTVIGTY